MATRAEVARRAGVSPSTVTYAITGKRRIGEATRKRVLAAMADLDYAPNAMAASLAGGRSRIVAMLFPSGGRDFADSDSEYLMGAVAAARELNHRVLMWPVDQNEVGDVVGLGRSGLVEGVLLMEVEMDDERVSLLQEAGIPLATIGRTADPSATAFADRDFAEVGRTAISHLAGLGHTHVVLMSAEPREPKAATGAIVRSIDGVQRAALAAGVQVAVIPCEQSVAAGRRFLEHVRTAHPDSTAVISINDDGVVGLLQAAHTAGLRIPDDLSVMSTTVVSRHTPFFHPELTTVSPPAPEIGHAAARALIAGLEAPGSAPEQSLWTGELVERASTGPRPGRDA